MLDDVKAWDLELRTALRCQVGECAKGALHALTATCRTMDVPFHYLLCQEHLQMWSMPIVNDASNDCPGCGDRVSGFPSVHYELRGFPIHLAGSARFPAREMNGKNGKHAA